MALAALIARNSLTGGIVAFSAILAVGCGSHSSGASGQNQASSPAVATSASVAPASAPSCLTSNLRISLGDGGAAAGTDYRVLDFTNNGTKACTLYGFPGVSLASSSDARIGAAATRNPVSASTLITLAPGAMANASVGIGTAANYPAGTCKPTAAAQLKVFPPNQTQAVELPITTTGCAGSAAHLLTVTAVMSGPGRTIKG